MGITISYRGKLKSIDRIDELIEEVKDIAETMEWNYRIWDEDIFAENTSALIHGQDGTRIEGHLPLKGIQFNPHPDSESVDLLFDKFGNLCEIITMCDTGPVKDEMMSVFIKTQYAPIDVHVAIVKLFKYLKKKYFSEFLVKDESDYWENDDISILKQKRDFLAEKIQVVSSIFNAAEIPDKETLSTDKLAQKLVDILKKKLDDLT